MLDRALDGQRDLSISRLGLGFLIPACVLAVIAFSCVKRSQTSTFVARVDDQYLTPEKVKRSVDTTARATDPQIRDFVIQWVNSTLLYEEARAEGYDRSSEVNETIEEIRRQLAINRLLEAEVYGGQAPQVTDEDIKTYYDQHKDAYLLAEDMAKIRYALFSDRDAASRFRSQLMKGKTWEDALKNLSDDSTFTQAIVEHVDSQYVKRSATPSTELWKAVTQLRVGDLSSVTKDDMGYYVAGLLGMQRGGESAELSSVLSETRDRVMVEKRQKLLAQLLERLKKKYTVQVNLTALEGVETSKARK